MKTVIATGNSHKVSEMKAILGDLADSVISMKEAGINCEIVEDGKTFMENSLIKARTVKKYWEGAVIADDSGIVIDALDGAPGVESARFMGEDTPYEIKNQAILDKMEGVEGKARSARFVCAMVAILPDGKEICVEETMEGEIAKNIKGVNGFGYDPIFFLPNMGCTSAELPPEGKNEISHRGKALRELQRKLKEEIEK